MAVVGETTAKPPDSLSRGNLLITMTRFRLALRHLNASP